jgi:hypothetical protein
MKAEITPLPYHVHFYNVPDGPVYALEATTDDDEWEIGQIWNYGDDAEATAEYIVRCANAHPELVKALEAARREIVELKGNHGEWELSDAEAVLKQIESALALAGRAAQSDGKEKE